MLPTEVEHKSFHVHQFNEEQSDDSRVDDLTRLEELRKAMVIQSVKHHQAMSRYHAQNVSSRSFQAGDLYYERSKRLKTGTSFLQPRRVLLK
jgi:hypothetical protein